MRFRAKFLQPVEETVTAADGATLMQIYDVCMTPDGRVEGGGKSDLTGAVEHRGSVLGASTGAASE
jgi:hypothetical protein